MGRNPTTLPLRGNASRAGIAPCPVPNTKTRPSPMMESAQSSAARRMPSASSRLRRSSLPMASSKNVTPLTSALLPVGRLGLGGCLGPLTYRPKQLPLGRGDRCQRHLGQVHFALHPALVIEPDPIGAIDASQTDRPGPDLQAPGRGQDRRRLHVNSDRSTFRET